MGYKLPVSLKEFSLSEFDVILGIYWLSRYHAYIQCRDQKLMFGDPKGNRISYSGVVVKMGVKLMSTLRMRKLH